MSSTVPCFLTKLSLIFFDHVPIVYFDTVLCCQHTGNVSKLIATSAMRGASSLPSHLETQHNVYCSFVLSRDWCSTSHILCPNPRHSNWWVYRSSTWLASLYGAHGVQPKASLRDATSHLSHDHPKGGSNAHLEMSLVWYANPLQMTKLECMGATAKRPGAHLWLPCCSHNSSLKHISLAADNKHGHMVTMRMPTILNNDESSNAESWCLNCNDGGNFKLALAVTAWVETVVVVLLKVNHLLQLLFTVIKISA